MPQLETATYLSQFFWLIISFLSLWFCMAWFIIPKIEEIMEQRRRKIDDFVQKAEKINKQALVSLNKYEKALERAKNEAEHSFEENKKQLEKLVSDRHIEIEKLLNQQLADTEFMLAKERQETLVAIDKISTNIAKHILNKLDINDVSDDILEKYAGGKH